jgi:hypothetical protein
LNNFTENLSMQKIFCLLITALPLSAIAQENIGFSSSAKIIKQNAENNKILQRSFNNDGHTLELIFTVAAAQQHIFRNMAGLLNTPAGKLNFIFPGETMMQQRNKLRFTNQAGKVYVFFNDMLRSVINDEQHAYAVCTPGYVCSLTDVETNTDLIVQTECITVGYRDYEPPSSAPAIINETGKNIQTVNVFPNPAHNSLQITTGSKDALSIMLLNAEGKQLAVKTNAAGNILDIQDLPPGSYFLRIDTGKNTPIIRSFIKQ